MAKNAIIIALIAIGYCIALTLIIINAIDGCTANLFLLFPMFITPAMTFFIRPDSEDHDFWTMFGIFWMTVGVISSIAMPISLRSMDSLETNDLGYGLGASFTLLSFYAIAGLIHVKYQENIW